MPRTRMARISFGKDGSIWVFWTEAAQRKKRRFDPGNMTKALGFACRIMEDQRDQSCVLVPPNALLSLLLYPSDHIQREWHEGFQIAEEMLAAVV